MMRPKEYRDTIETLGLTMNCTICFRGAARCRAPGKRGKENSHYHQRLR